MEKPAVDSVVLSTTTGSNLLINDLACFERCAAVDPEEEEQIRREVLSSGVDLREFAQSVESSLAQAERGGLDAYIQEAANLRKFHNNVADCDDILQKMNDMLQTFQDRLGNISSEIQYLQKQSANMSIKLKNRQAVRGELSQYINELVVPEAMINHILDTPVTDRGFVEQLHELNHKINFSKQQAFQDARSAQDVREALIKLKVRAIAKLREYLLQRVQQFKKPLVNYQMAQNALLKYRFFYEFLLNNEREIAREILDEYSDTIAKVYYAYFKTYVTKLLKLENENVPSKDDVIGHDETVAKKAFSFSSILNPSHAALNVTSTLTSALSSATSSGGATSTGSSGQQRGGKTSVFSLCGRDSVLQPGVFDGPVLIPHVAELESATNADKRYSFEQLFRSLQYALVDNAVREHFFLSDFFLLSGRAAADLFNSIWIKTFQAVTKTTEDYAASSHDAVGLLLCVQVCSKLHHLVRGKNVDVMDHYLAAQINTLLPRLQSNMIAHIESLQRVDPHNMHIDLTPHYMSRRCAEFLASLIVIRMQAAGGGGGIEQHDEMLASMMMRLKQEMDGLLLRMAAEFSERKHQLIFLINNYDLLCSVIAERLSAVNRIVSANATTGGGGARETSSGGGGATVTDDRELQSIRDQLNLRCKEYIEEVLSNFFGPLLDFVKSAERQLQQQQNDKKAAQPARASSTLTLPAGTAEKISRIITSFNSSWKKAVEDINSEIITSFGNFNMGRQILQMTLSQLLQCFHRFQVVLTTPPFKDAVTTGGVKGELINKAQFMMELKKWGQAQF